MSKSEELPEPVQVWDYAWSVWAQAMEQQAITGPDWSPQDTQLLKEGSD